MKISALGINLVWRIFDPQITSGNHNKRLDMVFDRGLKPLSNDETVFILGRRGFLPADPAQLPPNVGTKKGIKRQVS